MASNFPAEGLPRQFAVARPVGAVGLFPPHDRFHQLEHLHALGLVVVEGPPGVAQQFLQFFRRHVAGLEDHLVGGVLVPVVGQDALLLVQLPVGLGVGEGRQHGELRQVQIDFQEKIHQTLDAVFGVAVQAQQDGALDPDAMVVVALDALPDGVRAVEDRLVYVPGPGPGGQIEHVRLVFDGVAAPFFLEGNHLPEEVPFPLGVLGQGVVHDKEAVVVDGGHLGNGLLDGPGTEMPASQEGHAAGIAVEAAAPGGMHQVHHLNAFVVVEIAIQDIPAGGAHPFDGGTMVQIVIDRLEAFVPEILDDPFHAALGFP